MQNRVELRGALAEFAGRVERSTNVRLRVMVRAYLDQVERLLQLADESTEAGKSDDADRHAIAAQRWLWKIAKTCTLIDPE